MAGDLAQSGHFCKMLRHGHECSMEPDSLFSVRETGLGLLAIWMCVLSAAWLFGLHALVYFTMRVSEYHWHCCRYERRRAGLCIFGAVVLYTGGLLVIFSLYAFNADQVPTQRHPAAPHTFSPSEDTWWPYHLANSGDSRTNMSRADLLRVVQFGPVMYWDYADLAGILFGCLVLFLPLTAYVMGADGDDED
mmetsp:Transcript_32694/g.61433  ORF Transcript_32694/g.61433 Transcript_32694/m.61433 type:complete len:192 (-) Transcript_32694:67-642(-)